MPLETEPARDIDADDRPLYALPRVRRAAVKYAIDLAFWSLATPVAFALRLDTAFGPGYLTGLLWLALLLVPAKAAIIFFASLHRRVWRKSSTDDLVALVFAIGAVFVLSWVILFFAPPSAVIPRSVPLIEAIAALVMLGGGRMLLRLAWERRRHHRSSKEARRVLIIGAGEAGALVAREMQRHPEAGLRPVGFLDDDPLKRRKIINGLPVFGPLTSLTLIADEKRIDEVVIALPSARGETVRRVVRAAQEADVAHRIVPGIYELLSGNVTISQIREVNLEDLLRRDPVRLETDSIFGYIEGRVVLVTGAGGSIGSEIVRQVARFRASTVVLVGRGENSIFLIEQEMRRTHPDMRIVPVICDVRDEPALRSVFEAHRPEIVFHAAAHKHVPLMEANPDQAVFNNVGGTQNVATLCLDFGVERLVNISTDKAVNPTSVMGASKRVAEQVVLAAAQEAADGGSFVSVRFGNVLGSRGSVVPFFKEQIARGGPVTITHPDMIRYFMTIPEAAQLVLQAGAMNLNGAVFVLDMGEPVRILDLANDLIRLSGFEPERDIKVVSTGMRPGEKLFEELLTAEEGTDASVHEQIFIARRTSVDRATLRPEIDRLFEAARARSSDQIRSVLGDLIPASALTPALRDALNGAAPLNGAGGDGAADHATLAVA